MPIQRLTPSMPRAWAGFSARTIGHPNAWMPGYREDRVDRELGLWVECVWRRSGGMPPGRVVHPS
jgi:hypothetical protein